MSARRVLIASPHYWTSTFQLGSHHFARAFAKKGWRVAYVSNPISPLHLLGGRSTELQQRLAIWRRGGIVDPALSIWTYVPAALASPHRAPLLRSRLVHRNWHRLTLPNVVRMIQRHGFGEVDLLYLDSVIQPFWLRAVPHQRSILRVADRMRGFPQFTSEMHAMQRDVARSVDAVVYTSMGLRDEIDALAPRRRIHLPNGVDFDHFAYRPTTVPVDLARVARPIAVYVGAMDEWFDYGTVNALVATLPDVSFVLIGPDHMARRRLKPSQNLHLLGSRQYSAVPAYLHHSDVGLIPFDVVGHRALVEAVHPLKLYEYLAAGLPVVASHWDEIGLLQSPALLYRSATQAVTAVRWALSSPPPAQEGVSFARAARWANRLDSLLGEVGLS